jgi:hypothetical protein
LRSRTVFSCSMRMRPAGAAYAARARIAGAGFAAAAVTARARGKHGKFLRQFLRTAMRALRPLPMAGTHQHLAVLPAFPAVKFVNWHGGKITAQSKSSSWNPDSRISPSTSIPDSTRQSYIENRKSLRQCHQRHSSAIRARSSGRGELRAATRAIRPAAFIRARGRGSEFRRVRPVLREELFHCR